ncbi:major facilitator transporter [Amycolatopsis mediterranei S699]|uniref:Major facilitator transporter n=2 Tax=Amycolatopsis mediterranei TaxID=33910 RepID=A0A0H3D761_AMYMU|nr:MFS transporter [Amycolatopsis mediterranei]ADJ45334.1 major facilitator transporter [Amycolatopsis mediterranei U32]AEK42094.1 major facilitator transporter [Amycolatopsis mediterranei S699]AFO77045.1 major facilitator transporter [Amycolatopsis mediterranei S699]AGT84173.1 major facilitator transporter [Amycolatopsis mediterranei RB]KDO08450.1 MFS transporter [Amycolatopsis mediterranei]
MELTDRTQDRLPTPTSSRGRSAKAFWSVAAVYALVMLGGTLPVPLYAFWSADMDFGPFTTTLIFAGYAVGVVISLLLFAGMSDRSGRRPLALAALSVVAVSTVIFLLAGNVVVLLVARFLSGLATGVVTATATAWLGELAGPGNARRATITATAVNLGGLGLGPLAAGLTAQFAPAPAHLVFWLYLGALVPAFAAVALAPETVADRRPARVAARRPTVPAEPAGRREFATAAAGVFAAFAVNALFASLVPSFLHDGLRVSGPAVVGGVVSLLFLVALTAQLSAPRRRLESRWFAVGALVAGVGLLVAGLWLRSPAVFVAGTVLAGAGSGLTFRRGLGVTAALADPRRRADLNATYFLAAYAGNVVPALVIGGLDQAFDANVATSILAAALIGLIFVPAVRHRRHPA